MNQATAIAERYLATWNETDAKRRGQLLVEGWMPSARYVDPLMQGQGVAEIDQLIAAVHQRFPGWRFTLIGAADGYADQVRFSWSLGPVGGEAVIKGTDFATLQDDRLLSVSGFLDQIPEVP